MVGVVATHNAEPLIVVQVLATSGARVVDRNVPAKGASDSSEGVALAEFVLVASTVVPLITTQDADVGACWNVVAVAPDGTAEVSVTTVPFVSVDS